MIQYAITCAVFAFCSYTDIRYQRIGKKAVLAYLLLVLGGYLFCGEFRAGERMEGFIPGIVCITFSAISRQALGYGDSILILICGISLGLEACVSVLMTAFFWSGVWAVFQMCRREPDRSRGIPFVPFLLAGAVLQWIGSV